MSLTPAAAAAAKADIESYDKAAPPLLQHCPISAWLSHFFAWGHPAFGVLRLLIGIDAQPA